MGRGLGRGFARRRPTGAPFSFWTWGPPGWAPASTEEEVRWLKEEAEALRQELQLVEQRLEELTRKESG